MRELFHLAFGLPDPAAFDALVERLSGRGLSYLGPLEHEARADEPSVKRRAIYVRDPDGHVVEITEDV